MMNTVQKELQFSKGKRKYIFCADTEGAGCLYKLVQQAMEERAPFEFFMVEPETESFLELWFSQQKMGSYLYFSGKSDCINRLKKLAFAAGFSEHEMQMKVMGTISKKVICCKCHGGNDVDDDSLITCMHCGLELEVSGHFSRRLDAYLGYYSIK
jgi:dimethylamine monooxygenase subunit C